MEKTVATLTMPEENVYQNEIELITAQAKELVVCDNDSYSIAGNVLKEVKSKQKMVIDFFAPLKDAANKAHKALTTR